MTSQLDLAMGLRMLRNRKDKYLEVVRAFSLGNAEEIASIRNGLSAGDPVMTERAVHSLKGAAGNLGVNALHDVAKELDELLRQPNPDEKRVMSLVNQLETVVQQLAEILAG